MPSSVPSSLALFAHPDQGPRGGDVPLDVLFPEVMAAVLFDTLDVDVDNTVRYDVMYNDSNYFLPGRLYAAQMMNFVAVTTMRNYNSSVDSEHDLVSEKSFPAEPSFDLDLIALVAPEYLTLAWHLLMPYFVTHFVSEKER
jgi:hypothetical protein